MIERSIPKPKGLVLKIPNKKLKQRIKESCIKEGYKHNYIYWTATVNNEIIVYVAVQKEVNQFILLTCFKYQK